MGILESGEITYTAEIAVELKGIDKGMWVRVPFRYSLVGIRRKGD